MAEERLGSLCKERRVGDEQRWRWGSPPPVAIEGAQHTKPDAVDSGLRRKDDHCSGQEIR